MPGTNWHPQLDNPTLLGWTVVVVYLLAAAACCWAAFKADKEGTEGNRIWWLLAVGLLFLGINKQLNLQTLLIVLGRRAAVAGGWYERRRLAQAVFAAAFGLLGLCFLGIFATRARLFVARNRLAFLGVLVLLLFVVLRASTINHANELFGVELKDDRWAWLLELCGSLLIAFSAASRDRAKAEIS
jgi:hypothetical protein